MIKDYTGMNWGELSEKEQRDLLKNANAVDGATGCVVDDGECIVDLTHPWSVAGRVQDGEICINDNAEIYNPVGDEF